MGTNAERQGSDGTGHSMVTLGPVGRSHLTVQRRALIRGLVLCLALTGWLAPGYGGLPVAAAGTTRYVAATGSDSGDCSASAAPCKTIEYALGQAQGGDTISIAAGTYAEHLAIEKNLTLVGAGASTTALDGSTSGTVVTIGISNTAAVVTLSGLTVQHGNVASNNSGGIINAGSLTLASSTVVSNTSTSSVYGGGGIYNTGTLTLTNSTVAANSISDPLGGFGGGIYSDGRLTLTNSAVAANHSAGFSGWSTDSKGGGIDNLGTLTLTNSTISGNSAGFVGGGVYNGDGGTVALTNSTISGNSVADYGGGIINYGTLTLTNSILAGNTASAGRPDCAGPLTSGGYNLLGINDGWCHGLTNGVNGDQVGTGSSPLVPLLDPMGDYGGPTLTMAPQPGA